MISIVIFDAFFPSFLSSYVSFGRSVHSYSAIWSDDLHSLSVSLTFCSIWCWRKTQNNYTFRQSNSNVREFIWCIALTSERRMMWVLQEWIEWGGDAHTVHQVNVIVDDVVIVVVVIWNLWTGYVLCHTMDHCMHTVKFDENEEKIKSENYIDETQHNVRKCWLWLSVFPFKKYPYKKCRRRVPVPSHFEGNNWEKGESSARQYSTAQSYIAMRWSVSIVVRMP